MDRIDIMRLFVRIVERRSFAQAARDLQVPRATATHAIQRLEADLGVRLLERTTRSVRPTLDGALYHERCIRILADLDEIADVFRNAEPKGPLRVDVQGTIARFFVLPALPEFIARYPNISLNISEADRMVDLITEGVDCVLRAGELPDSSLVGRRLTAFEQMTLASPAYLDRHSARQQIWMICKDTGWLPTLRPRRGNHTRWSSKSMANWWKFPCRSTSLFEVPRSIPPRGLPAWA
jgi:DNA-binding transcriptional LysR family regulator